ncbi:MAG: hypothetical protein LBG89_01760 [Rickettsiales bacterium]|jgi:hypothetical protein|nr:hypothetical protein [Rickettsiales bacterium]
MDKKVDNAVPIPDYPQRFDIKTEPQNRYIELSRVLAIAALISAGLLVVLAGAVYFAKRYQGSEALIIVRSRDSSAWSVIDESRQEDNMSQRVIQEYVAREFVRRWFNVSASASANDAAWKTCVLSKCGQVDENIQGEICCQTTADIFAGFMNTEVLEYRKMFDGRRARGVAVDTDGEPDVRARPLSRPEFGGNGTMWRLRFDVVNYDVGAGGRLVEAGREPVVAFVRIGTNNQIYPKNMGQYVSEFRYFFRDKKE